MEKNTKTKGLLMVLPPFLTMMLIVIVPVINSTVLSFYNEKTEHYDLSNYISIFTDQSQLDNIRYTLHIVIVTVLLCILISFSMALYMRFSKSKAARIIEKIYIIPKFVPTMVAVYALILILRDTGVVNRFFLLFGVDFKLGMMYTEKGIILANLWFNIPFATMLLHSSLMDISDSIIEGARDVGAGKFRILINIILPLSFRTLLISATFVFMGNIGEFTTPYLMGTNSPRMLGVALQQEFGVFYNLPRASAMSVVMFLLSSVAGGFYIASMMKKDEWIDTE
jgi:ABC-type spermidine/putrescine transport system permease subunit I